MLIAYGFVASILPWLLLAPRDYLSTFLKIGAIAALALGILFVAPDLKMPAVTRFVDGTGPVWSGALFPFLFITIACGAVSGFHSLISSGTTAKTDRQRGERPLHRLRRHADGVVRRHHGAGLRQHHRAGRLLHHELARRPDRHDLGQRRRQGQRGFAITPEQIDQTAKDVGEHTIISRTGGAPTLAVGMAQIFASFPGGKAMMAFWYHFAILFEALFILTAVDAGTRAGRFMLQDLLGVFAPGLADTTSWVSNIVATALCVGAWGYFLYQGVTDPLGGVNTLWPLFGISNQMLAAVALTLCTVVIFKMKRERYAWVTIVPLTWLAICTMTAGLQRSSTPIPASASCHTPTATRTRWRRGRCWLRPRADEPDRVQRPHRRGACLSLRSRRHQHPLLRRPVLPEAYRTDRWTAHETDMALPTPTGAGARAAAAAMR